MSRIRAEECEQLDLEWYGVDKQGNIAVFCSAGEGNLPEFVCEDAERADELIDYFANIGKITNSVLVFPQEESAAQTARDFSDKGLYSHLELWRIPKLDDISAIRELKNLESLKLQDLKHITELPDISDLTKFKDLILINTPIAYKSIPEYINIKSWA